MTDVIDSPADAPPEEKKKLQQTVDIKDVGPCKKHIKVTVHRADIDAYIAANRPPAAAS